MGGVGTGAVVCAIIGGLLPRARPPCGITVWVSLLGRGGLGRGGRKASYDMTLWRPALFRACPSARPPADVHRRLDYLRTFRNRIAHYDPIFARHLAADHASILLSVGWASPDVQTWIEAHSRAPRLLALPRDEAGRTF
jgi:hypothetical protein